MHTLIILLACIIQLYANTVEVKGKIMNEDGAPVAATVIVKGTDISTKADMNGEFVLTGIDEQSTLLICNAGIEPREVRLNGRTQPILITVRSRISFYPLH